MQGRPRSSDWGDVPLPEVVRATSQGREGRLGEAGEGTSNSTDGDQSGWGGWRENELIPSASQRPFLGATSIRKPTEFRNCTEACQ